MIGYPVSYGDDLSHDNAFKSEALVKVISTKVEDICTEERIFLFKKGFAVGSMVVGVSSLLTDAAYAAYSSGGSSSGSGSLITPPSDGTCVNPPGPPAGGPVPVSGSGPSPNPKFKPAQIPSADRGLIAGASVTMCTVAARTGSFWVGFACAVSIAVCMDLARLGPGPVD